MKLRGNDGHTAQFGARWFADQTTLLFSDVVDRIKSANPDEIHIDAIPICVNSVLFCGCLSQDGNGLDLFLKRQVQAKFFQPQPITRSPLSLSSQMS